MMTNKVEHELEVHVAPASTGNSCGSCWIDFLTFWQIRLPLWLQGWMRGGL